MIMRETKEKAYAKLNLSLDVTSCRDDGYHDMLMVMQTVSLCDDVSVRFNDSGKIKASCNLPFIPCDERNLAVKAAIKYLEAIGESSQGLDIDLQKNIPVGAGMAGGSSNAAAVLRALNRLYSNRLSVAELEEIAGSVGSDVAFCVAGGTSLAKGRGEILTELKAMPDCYIVICKPEFSISTPELFKKLDSSPMRHHPDTQGILQALEDGELRELCMRMYNVFEDVDDRRMRTVAEIKGTLLDHGAMGAIMTGTGSAVFGIFSAEEQAMAAKNELNKEHKFCCISKPQPRID